MYLQAIALVCLSVLQSFSCDEAANTGSHVIFDYLGIDPKTVSKHQLTTIDVSTKHKRDLQQGTALKFQAIDEEISLWLSSRESMLASDETPVYVAHYAPGFPDDIYLDKIEGAMRRVGKLLEDPKHFASVVLGTDDAGKTTVNGHLISPRNNARLVINSLPEHIVKGFFNNRSSIDDLIDDKANMTYHVVIELNDENDLQKVAMKGLRGLKVEMTNQSSATNANSANNQTPDTLYPEILVHLDHTYRTAWIGENLTSALEYALTFWNGVDLIYRHIENPKIRLNIAGIIFSDNILGTPYFVTNWNENTTAYDKEGVARDVGKFYYSLEKTSPVVDFDAVVVMTENVGSDLGPPITYFFATRAGQGTICHRDDILQDNHGVAVVTDYRGYEGIFMAAHQIGHLLGAANEDDSAHVNCTKIGDGSALMDSDNTLMKNRIRLSDCALEDIRRNFDAGALDCLLNVPTMTGTRLPVLMPGRQMNIIRICESFGLGRPCIPNSPNLDVCDGLWCTPANDPSLCSFSGYAAPAGTPCLKNNFTEYGVCLKGTCVSV